MDRSDHFSQRYGSWAVVTGASDGVGRAFAHQLAARGLNLVLVARRDAILRSLANDLTQTHGIECRVMAIDLADPDASHRLANATLDLDVGLLVAAAGFGSSGPFLAGDPANETDMLDVNCRAVLAQCWHFGQRLTLRGRGGVVLLSSLVAFQGAPRAAHYAATKAYVQALAEGLRTEWTPLGVDVIASAPGPIATGFAARADMRMGQALSPEVVAAQSLSALGRKGTVRPGWLSKVLGWSLSTAPRPLRVAIIGRIMSGMTSHQARRADPLATR